MCSPEVLRQNMRMVTLLLGWLLSIAGVASPWWRWLDEGQYSRYEGLWHQCVKLDTFDTSCQFSKQSSGLWRAIQVVKLTSLAILTIAFVSLLAEIICCPTSRKQAKNSSNICPASSITALVGGLTGLVGDLLYVGFIEYNTVPLPGEYVYYWSFAWCVGGSCMSLLAALVIGLTSHPCLHAKPDEPSETKVRHWSDTFYRRRPEGYTVYQPGRGTYHLSVDYPYRGAHSPYVVGDFNREIHNPYIINEAYGLHGRDPYQRSNRPYIDVEDSHRRSYHSGAGDPYGGSSIDDPARASVSYAGERNIRMYPSIRGLEAPRGRRISLPPIYEHSGPYPPTDARDSISDGTVRLSSNSEGPPGYVSGMETPRTLDSESTSQQREAIPPPTHDQGVEKPIQDKPQAPTIWMEQLVPVSPGTIPSSTVTVQAEQHVRSEEGGLRETVNLARDYSMDDAPPLAVSTLRRVREPRHVDFERVPAVHGARPIEGDVHRQNKIWRIEEPGGRQEAVFPRYPPALKRLRAASRRGRKLPLYGHRYGQHGRWHEFWRRQPGQSRMVIKARRDSYSDLYN